jgi:hypothetical protein
MRVVTGRARAEGGCRHGRCHNVQVTVGLYSDRGNEEGMLERSTPLCVEVNPIIIYFIISTKIIISSRRQ